MTPRLILCGSLMLAVLLLAGCAPRYNIVMNNGQKITARGKPKRDQFGVLTYIDAKGQPAHISSSNVRTVEPAY